MAAALCLLAACGGTGHSPEDATDELRGLREQVLAVTKDALSEWQSAGLELERAAGDADTCRSEPSPGVTYLTAGSTVETQRYGPTYTAARQVALDQGWNEVDQGEDPYGLYSTLERAGLSLSLGRSPREGSEALFFRVTTRTCVDVPDAGFIGELDLREQLIGTPRS